VYRDYIHRSTRRYRNVIQKAGRLHITDPRHLTAILWNDGLYFELHELLETFWLETHGNERTALKGLIQAAGVYVHSLRGNLRAARGLAVRARENLNQGLACLDFISGVDMLIQCLEDPAAPPPKLGRIGPGR